MKKTDHSDKGTGKMQNNSKKKAAHKAAWHPISTPIFFFYLIMSVMNGSASLLFLGAAAALGAWALEEIFMATSGLADSRAGGGHRSDRTEAERSRPEEEFYACSQSERPSHLGDLLSMSNQGSIVFLKQRAS